MNEPQTPKPPSAPRAAGARAAVPRPAGSRPPGSGGGSGATPRGEYVPAKKKGAPPALTISLLAAIVVTAGVFGWAILTKDERQANAPTIIVNGTNDPQWEAILKKKREAERLFHDTMELRLDEEKAALFQKKIEETTAFINDILEEFDEMLEKERDPTTGQLPPDLMSYNKDMKSLVQMLSDLSKATPFGIGADGAEKEKE